MPDTSNKDTYYPPAGFYFQVQFSGQDMQDIGHGATFQEVSGISAQIDTEEVTEGSANRFVHRVPDRVKYENLVLKRGLLYRNTPMAKWCIDAFSNGLGKAVKPKDITVNLLNADGHPAMTWTFFKAFPVKWEVSSFNAQDNELVLESLEIAYTYFQSL